METINQPTGSSKDMIMGILAYLGILVIIPYLAAKDDPFVKFHIKQGLVLLVISAVGWILSIIIFPFMLIFWIVKIAVVILVIIGIINVVQGKEKNLPIIGDWARHFNF